MRWRRWRSCATLRLRHRAALDELQEHLLKARAHAGASAERPTPWPGPSRRSTRGRRRLQGADETRRAIHPGSGSGSRSTSLTPGSPLSARRPSRRRSRARRDASVRSRRGPKAPERAARSRTVPSARTMPAMTITRSLSRSTSLRTCELNGRVRSCADSQEASLRVSPIWVGSRPLVGSSSTMTGGS